MAPSTNTETTKKKQEPISADAFEDDFIEEDVYSDTNDVDDEGTIQSSAAKRKLVDDDSSNNNNTSNNEPSTKKKKKNNNKQNKKKAKDPFYGLKIWTESPTVQADYVADRLKQALPSLTALETIPMTSEAFVDNAKFKQEHTMDALPNYIKFAVMRHKKLTKKPVGFGAPLVIVATHSAIRAADLSRGLKEFASMARIAKLFAKHIKLQEQIDLLASTPIHLAVGTPQRLAALAEQGSLKLDQLELVVIDTDTTKGNYNLMEQLSGRESLFTFLNSYIAPRMQAGNSKLGLF